MNNCNSVATLIETITDFSKWEEEITRVTAKVAADLAKELLQAIDEHLDKTRQTGLRLLGYRSLNHCSSLWFFSHKKKTLSWERWEMSLPFRRGYWS